MAAYSGHEAVVRLLLQCNARIDAATQVLTLGVGGVVVCHPLRSTVADLAGLLAPRAVRRECPLGNPRLALGPRPTCAPDPKHGPASEIAPGRDGPPGSTKSWAGQAKNRLHA
jgi:hypothetical protein